MTQKRRRWYLPTLALAASLAGPAFAGGETTFTDDHAPVIATRPDGTSVILQRCGTPNLETRLLQFGLPSDPLIASSDCGVSATNPDPAYDPDAPGDVGRGYLIDVYVHVIMNTLGDGNVPDSDIYEQMGVLSEDFRAIPGSLGAPGTDTRFFFRVAPDSVADGPGITRDTNNTWYADGGSYWNTLARRPATAINIYTNNASGNLGYVPFLPADAGGTLVGTLQDRVVIYWESFGLTSFTPYHLGRTTTHELGHYFGLEHTFNGGCGDATPPGCYTTADLICDTNAESSPFFGGLPCTRSTCSSPDPTDNYMDYSDDICMDKFTLEQSRRIRCSQYWWRSGLLGQPVLFYDGYETSDFGAWDAVTN